MLGILRPRPPKAQRSHERMRRELKAEAILPPGYSLGAIRQASSHILELGMQQGSVLIQLIRRADPIGLAFGRLSPSVISTSF